MLPRKSYIAPTCIWAVLVIVILWNGIVSAETEKDFDFEDTDVISVKKRAAALTDDEDLLNDEAGSTPEVDGSGTDEVEPSINLPEYYRVSINFTDLSYDPELENMGSVAFTDLANPISKAIQDLFRNIDGEQNAIIIKFSPGSLVVTFDLATEENYDRMQLYNTLLSSVNSGAIPPYRVSPVGFKFRPLQDGRACPDYTGRDASPLPRSGDNQANLLINNEFFCHGYVIGWNYYRIVPRHVGYASVWRQISPEEFILVGETQLPVAAVGNHTVRADPPIPVERGDIIGIFYPRDVTEGVVANAGSGDLSEAELYQNYHATFYHGDVETGSIFSLESVSYQDVSATFAIRALMDYTGVSQVDETGPTCRPDQFTCDEGGCVDGRYKCDGQNDCPDQSDEKDCADIVCADGEVKCRSIPQCIPQTFLCNSQTDCSDGSDEEDCPVVDCTSLQFQCKNGQCINKNLRCDMVSDCSDGTDEIACQSVPCQPGEFQCEMGKCIADGRRCDGNDDCPDRTDELDCPSCQPKEFQCKNGDCIPGDYKCDGYQDCNDNSDETECDASTHCPEAQYRCDDGACVKPDAQCDGVVDCLDGSDEAAAKCEVAPACPGADEFECATGQCVPSSSLCNYVSDCTDGSDENVVICGALVNITTLIPTVRVGEGAVAEFECFAIGNVGVELTWTKSFGEMPGQAKIQDGRLIIPFVNLIDSGTYLCSAANVTNITPATAELIVSEARVTLTITRTQQILNEGETAVFDCTASGLDLPIVWTRGSQDLPPKAIVEGGRLTIPHVTVEDADSYICGVGEVMDIGITEATAELLVTPACPPDNFRCTDGTCISITYKCDGFSDCSDNSDETHCEERSPCPEGQYRCDDGSCVDAKRCDGVRECPDSSDEFPGLCGGCDAGQFMCGDGTRCVQLSQVCDRRPDCFDKSDEHTNCTCHTGEFTCADGSCIPDDLKCDQTRDCPDGSDESNCPLCPPEDFTCANEIQCVDRRLVCDGYDDCDDGSDESSCPCRDDQFTCANGDCIPNDRQCDRRLDCEDGSDEHNCACRDDQFTCANGDCIPNDRQCDRRLDCEDGSDEHNCACRDDQFTCANGDCIPNDRQCDGILECEDGSDEHNCACRDGEFRCSNGDCIPGSFRCNGRPECEDNSDELNCPKVCSADEFTCRNGDCVPGSFRCNGRPECEDSSDETGCAKVCSAAEFTCRNGDCVPGSFRCNGRPECEDSSDETGCAVGCRDDEFTCSDRACIPLSRKCDQRADCEDGSDEANCQCRSGEFRCRNGQCIDRRRRCNRQYDCHDGTDEFDCPVPIVITVTPPVLMVREGAQAEFVCQATGRPRPDVRWSRHGNQALPLTASDERGHLLIPDLQLEDAGDYVCSAIGVQGTFEATARLDVRRIGPQTTPDPGPCGAGESVCQSGQCIPSDYRCDGDTDCEDGSDEAYCRADSPCEPNEFRCGTSGICVMKIWRCDGDNDCGDGFDELDCPTGPPGAQCRMDEYQCRSGDQCLPASYHCDGEIDCQDRSDEIGCSVPTIILPPVSRIDVDLGGLFTIICEAMGTPTPLIVWRLNWGNIPTGDRIHVTSFGGRGNLTITDARITDSGAYTCEAINTKGAIFATPDAIIIVRRSPQPGVCSPPEFNVEASISSECLRCFCFGQTTNCYSGDLHVSEIRLFGTMTLVDQTSRGEIIPATVTIEHINRDTYQIRDFIEVLPAGNYYWNLPNEFLGDRLATYGGHLRYTVRYEIVGDTGATNQPDVVLVGNGITLYHRTSTILSPGGELVIQVPIIPSAWSKSDGRTGRRGDIPAVEPTTREDLMMVLENVEAILVRANYDIQQVTSTIGAISVSTGVVENTGLGRAVYVEECECPAGYSGYSCQDCAAGYRRIRQGPYLGICRRCNCNGHSNDCDPETGECRVCAHYTEGPQCERCIRGFYGDATQGRSDSCRPCPCPLTEASNQFSPTCILEADGQPTCTACPDGYEGRNCERCARGYIGNPRNPGDRCRQVSIEERCDSRGSLQTRPDPRTGRCPCKRYVEGPNCDQCTPNTFHLSLANPHGCIACFCMGVKDTCTSTSWDRAQVGASFTRDRLGFSLTDISRNPDLTVTDDFVIDRNVRELIYRPFSRLPETVYYWSLPQRFLGDKLMSYGGSLRFVIMYRPGQDTTASPGPLVEISGNDIVLVHRPESLPSPNTPKSYNIEFYEGSWTRLDGQRTTREFLMMALADLDAILIRATFTRTTEQASIRSVILDIAEDRTTGQDRAYTVEQCVCPQGYRGLSCEDCDVGYTRSRDGLYLGRCVPCDCNGHSGECNPETGVCRNCQHNTEGEHCERCAAGSYGDATRGSPRDCQPCPCPLTQTPNQFSPTCILDTDNQVTCTACPAGHDGRRCERCIQGYTGNPNNPGDHCKIGPIEPVCNCDSRGTVPNTQCNPSTKQCQCKSYVQGLRCTTCMDGYFYMSDINTQGCLSCWCSGIASQCSSSNYYRDVLRPQLGSDGTHNFVLTNRRLNNIISDGFDIDVTRREIAFAQFQGIQREQESLFFSLPAKFRGNQIKSFGGYLRFTLDTSVVLDSGRPFRDVDVEFITSGQRQRMYHLFNPALQPDNPQTFEILLRESSFHGLDGSQPSRAAFMGMLADLEAILVRATFNTRTRRTAIRDVSMDTATVTPTGSERVPMVEECRCPQGYTGVSCEECASGYLRVREGGQSRCTRCNCNGHATSCDPVSGQCLDCQHNTEGDRCERCAVGYYGDATVGTTSDCRPCPCPLTIPSNQFSRSCYQSPDGQVTCDRCPNGYLGRDCGECDANRGYSGNPRDVGGSCKPTDVDQRPAITVHPVTLEEHISATVVFHCDVRGTGPFNVFWSRFDGQPLSTRMQSDDRFTLTIRDVIESDSGRYVCTATNIYGSRRGYVSLTVIGRHQPIRVRIETPQVTANEGESIRFVCLATGGHEAAFSILSWSRRGGSLPSQAMEKMGVLLIPNARREDAGDYVCTGSDMSSTDTAVAILIVSASQIAPHVSIEPRYQNVNQGDLAEFRCVATGTPVPTIEWRRGGGGRFGDHVTILSGVLHIPNAQPSDEAEYFCKATNVAGTNEIKTILYVTKIHRPDITVIIRQTTIIAIVGTTTSLYCYVEEDSGRTALLWSRRGGLPPGSTQDSGTLTLTNIQPSYSGSYVCTATSPTGTGTGTTEVTVTEATESPTATMEPSRLTVAMGTTGTLRCSITGKPQPTIKWSKAREELTSRHQVNGAVLRIVDARMEDRGIYVCRADNSAGVAQGWAIVEVERRMKPKIDFYPSGSQTISIGGSALFQCRVMDGDPPPTVTWTRAGGEVFTTDTTELMDNGVIMFKQVTGEEAGEYLCTAVNDIGSVSATAVLIIQGPPRIVIHPSRVVYVLVGERVAVECVAQGDPSPSVYWRYNTQPQRGDIPQEPDYEALSSIGSATLTLESVRTTDSGNYVCVATNTGGTSQETVQIIVREDSGPREPGINIDGPDRLSVEEGQRVELRCNTEGLVNPVVRWRRREGPLPPNHRKIGGTLVIPRFLSEYSGEYICTATAQQRIYETSVFIIVTIRPRLTVSPAHVEARGGQRVQLTCVPQGSGPFQIEWSKVQGLLNPRAVQTSEGTLVIHEVTAADAGRYRCVATSSVGSSDGYAEISVQVPPSVLAEVRQTSPVIGQSLSFGCNAQGVPRPVIRWEKEGGTLPVSHQIVDGVLTIYDILAEDEGRYICTATNRAGTARDYVEVNVQGRRTDPNVTVKIDTQTLNVGERVEMECVVTGTPRPTVRWSRVDDVGVLSPSAFINDNILVIPEVSLSDAGIYLCEAENLYGKVEQRVTLYIRERPLIRGQGDSFTAALGTSATLACKASGYPTPEIRWYRKNGEMPGDYDVEDGDLRIDTVRPEDAGMYVCNAQNELGSNEHSMELRVGDLVPRFTQDPVSFISYPPLNDVYLDFDILLSMRPETTDGLVIYNGQFEMGTTGDFVAFGMSEGYPEFRFDMGSGPAIIKGDHKLALDESHTVKLTRSRRQGTMVVDSEPPYVGTSPGNYQGLDLRGNLYLGGVPDFNAVPRGIGFREGFVGSVSQVKLKGVDLNLGAESIEMRGVEPYSMCMSQPCESGGLCRPANNDQGFSCICPEGFTGRRCEVTGEKCYHNACGSEGQCMNLVDRPGFKCICPFGKTGPGCQRDVEIVTPEFNRSSFITYPPIKGARYQMNIELDFKPATLDDGIILYSGHDDRGTGDYISMAIRRGYLECQYNTGSGAATLNSRNLLKIGQWTRVSLSKNNQEGTLTINNEEPVKVWPWSYYRDQYHHYYNYQQRRHYRYPRAATSPGNTVGLDLRTNLYVGGVEPSIQIPRAVQVTQGFAGCIAELTVNMRPVNLLRDAVNSMDVRDCSDQDICNRHPCLNGGLCESLTINDFQCTCPESFTGKNCESRINICNTRAPCQNDGICSFTDDGYRCDCHLGYMGDNCETAVTYSGPIRVKGDGFVELSRELFPYSQNQVEKVVELSIQTTQSNGLIFWHGEATPGLSVSTGDFMMIGLRDGYVYYSYELGSGEANMRSSLPVNDGQVHRIKVTRLGTAGTLAIDGGPKETGTSEGQLRMLNVVGNLYVGGVPDPSTMTSGRYTDNFIGCILEVRIQEGEPLSVPGDTVGGHNVMSC